MKWLLIFTTLCSLTATTKTEETETYQQPTYGLPIPETAWQVTQDPQRDLFDAAYLVHYTGFQTKHFRHYRLIRILSEEGKAAAEFSSDSKSLISVRGRVLYPDGQELVFDSTEDFVDLLAIRVKRKKYKSTILIPPGLTTDCIVEMEWFEKPATGRYKNIWYYRYEVRDDYYCMEKIFDLQELNDKKKTTSFWIVQPAEEPIELTSCNINDTHPVFIYKQIPPLEDQPFGNSHQAANTPCFIIYTRYHAPIHFIPVEDWSGTNHSFSYNNYFIIMSSIKSTFDDLQKIKPLRAFAAQLKHKLEQDEGIDLKKEPIRASKIVLKTLHEKITLTNRLNPEQLVAFRNQDPSQSDSLKDCFSTGWANRYQMNQLFVGLLRELDLRMQLIYTNPIDDIPYKRSESTPFAFDWRMPLVMIEEPNQRAMFCSWRPEFPPGMLPNELQATMALAIDPYDAFKHTTTKTLHFGPQANSLHTKLEAQLDDNGRYRLNLAQTGTGIYKTDTVRRLHHLRNQDQTPYLTELWQRRLGDDYALNTVECAPLKQLQDPVALRVEAEIDLGDQENRLTIEPFPGLDVGFELPTLWPAQRTQPINLPYCFVRSDTLSLTLPEGWTLVGQPSRQRENRVGRVLFSAAQDGRVVTVQRTLILKDNRLEAEAETQVRYFFAWLRETELQTIAVAKGGLN